VLVAKLRDLLGLAVFKRSTDLKRFQVEPIKNIIPNSSTAHTQSRVYTKKIMILDLYILYMFFEHAFQHHVRKHPYSGHIIYTQKT